MNVQEELLKLGFTSNEVRVYLALLRIGESKAGRIARESGLERSSTYQALNSLLREGLVSSVLETKRKIFAAAAPEHIVDVFKEKQERAAILIPQLKGIQNIEGEKENILKFRGYTGIRTVLYDILETCPAGGEYLTFGSEGQLSQRIPTFATIFVARKDRKKIKSRLLVRENTEGKAMSALTTVRYVSKEVISPSVLTVYENKIALILWTDVPESIIIDNAAAAASFRSYFEFMWQHAKRKPSVQKKRDNPS